MIHPHVTESIKKRIQQSQYPVVVIEAIKLFESGLDDLCDVIWVSHASNDHQLRRLIQSRNMPEAEARLRIEAQPPQSEKLNRANVVINTEGSFSSSWQQVQQALNDTIQVALAPAPRNINNFTDWTINSPRAFSPEQLEAFLQNFAGEEPSRLFEHLGTRMVLPLCKENQLSALINWENWNFTGTFKEIIPASVIEATPMIPMMAFEMDARKRQCEVLLLPNVQAQIFGFDPSTTGFETCKEAQIEYPAWQQAADKIKSDPGPHVWFKKLTNQFERKHVNTVKSNEDL